MRLPLLFADMVSPENKSHLPSLIQICLHSKEIHSTFESSNGTEVTLTAVDNFIKVFFSEGDWRRNLAWQVMPRIVNPWESLWTLLPSSFQCFSGWGHGLSVRVRNAQLVECFTFSSGCPVGIKHLISSLSVFIEMCSCMCPSHSETFLSGLM